MELKHYVWIFQQSAQHFADEVKRIESDIMRHTHFSDEPIAVPHVAHSPSRKAEIKRLRDSLKEYREIVAFCSKMREDLADASAEEFAKQMVHNFSFKK